MKTGVVLSPNAKVIGYKNGVPIYSLKSIKKVKSSKEKTRYRLAKDHKRSKTGKSPQKRGNNYTFFLKRIRIYNKNNPKTPISQEKRSKLWAKLKMSSESKAPTQAKILEFLSNV